MKGTSKVIAYIVALRWALDKFARSIALKKEQAVRCGIEMREQDLADGMNSLIDAVNAALEKEGRIGLRLTGRIELTEWEKKNEIPQSFLRD